MKHARMPSRQSALEGRAAVIGLVGGLAALTAIVGLACLGAPLAAQAQTLPAPTGDAAKGKEYFLAYHCYACHGYTAQTGTRRLVPMRFPQEAFIGYVQNSPIPDMPAYRDVPAAKLADLYAYIRSIPADAPDVSTIPLLNDTRARAAGTKR
jgi:mono/diheme cytochrome c family protein